MVLLVLTGSPARAASPDFNERFGYGYGQELAHRRADSLRRIPAHRVRRRHAIAVQAVPTLADAVRDDAARIARFVRERIVEESCLATAVYFEARSEPQDGQLAVATVILNRVKARNFPSSICAVVYQGASHLNGCQFSFACDGKPDLPKPGRAWRAAVAIAHESLSNDSGMDEATLKDIAGATYYHADYVKPRWSKALNRLTKIGHHIFYAQGQAS